MSEVLAQLEKKGGGGGLSKGLDNLIITGREGVSRSCMYTLNGAAHAFSDASGVLDPAFFATVNTSTGYVTFTQKGTYQIDICKNNSIVTAEVAVKNVNDSYYFFNGSNNRNYFTVITKLD